MRELKTTVPVRLYPTPDQAAILRAHGQEYINTSNVLVQALDSDVLPAGGQGTSTKDFTAALPSAVFLVTGWVVLGLLGLLLLRRRIARI